MNGVKVATCRPSTAPFNFSAEQYQATEVDFRHDCEQIYSKNVT